MNSQIEEKPIPKCKHCGEETTNNTESPFFGLVHRFGPTDHPFETEEKEF